MAESNLHHALRPAAGEAAKPFKKPETTAIVLVLIGVFKLFKATIATICGLTALHLVHRNIPIAEFADKVLAYVKIDPDNEHTAKLLAPLLSVTNSQLSLVAIVFFIYAALFLTEGVGLVLRKRWGEWVVVVVSSLLIPYEVYETIHRLTPVKCGILTVNLAIVVFLVYCLRRHKT